MEARTAAIFLVLDIVLGGAAAASAGRALARSWRAAWQIIAYMAVLGAFVRFLHYALFAEPLLTGAGFAADWVVALLFGGTGFALTRRRQMRRQYGWATAPVAPETE